MITLADSKKGIRGPQYIAEVYGGQLKTVSPEDIHTLIQGPSDPDYFLSAVQLLHAPITFGNVEYFVQNTEDNEWLALTQNELYKW